MRNSKIKRAIGMVLTAVMVAGMTAGCGSSGGNEPAAAGESRGSGETGSEQASAGLDVIKILGVNNSNTIGTGKSISLSDWVDGTSESKVWDKLTSDLEERGIRLELELIEPDQYETVVQTKIAAGLDCDIVNISSVSQQIRRSMISQKTIVPVNEIWENHSDGTAKDFYTTGDGAEIAKLNKMEDGNSYWLSSFTVGDYKGEKWGAFKGPMIRKDWVEKLKLKMPETADELYDTLMAFRDQDVNGNGEKDELAVLSYDTFDNGVAQMFGLGNKICYVDWETGEATSPWYQENIGEYITYMNKLYKSGLLEVSGQENEKKMENKVGFLNDWWLATWNNTGIAVEEGDAACYYCGILPQVGDGTKPLVNRQGGIQKMGLDFAVTAYADQDAVGRLIDYLSTEEYSILADYGIEGYSYEIVDGKKQRVTVEEDAADELQIVGKYPALFVNNSILPRIERSDRTVGLKSSLTAGYSMGYPETGFQEMVDRVQSVYDHPGDYAYMYMDTENVLAIATEEEQEKITDLQTDLDTYSAETLTKLIFGDASLEDLDTYIGEMKMLGLDDLIAVTQARFNRVSE